MTGLYFLARRNVAAAVFSAVAFAGTVALSFLVIGDAARTYFGSLVGDASRIGPVVSVMNQSLRGVLSRFAGHDVGTGPLWLAAVACAGVLCVLAWRGLDRDDRLGTMIVVQFFGLLVSPIFWAHHWVWLVPAIVWLVHGPLADVLVASLAAATWVVVLLLAVIRVLIAQSTFWEVQYSLPLASAGTIYPAGAVVVLLLMAAQRRLVRRHLAGPNQRVPIASCTA